MNCGMSEYLMDQVERLSVWNLERFFLERAGNRMNKSNCNWLDGQRELSWIFDVKHTDSPAKSRRHLAIVFSCYVFFADRSIIFGQTKLWDWICYHALLFFFYSFGFMGFVDCLFVVVFC